MEESGMLFYGWLWVGLVVGGLGLLVADLRARWKRRKEK